MKTVITKPNMAASKIIGEKYKSVYFQCGTYEDAELLNCIFFEVDIEGVWINEALFKGCKFESTLFYGVQAYSASFNDSTFLKTEFKGCNLSKANFSGCIFNDVAFGVDNIGSVTDISGACFDDVDLKRTTFINVEYDVETKFPKGFAPHENKGLKLIQN